MTVSVGLLLTAPLSARRAASSSVMLSAGDENITATAAKAAARARKNEYELKIMLLSDRFFKGWPPYNESLDYMKAKGSIIPYPFSICEEPV
jgi:hypothetical protein